MEHDEERRALAPTVVAAQRGDPRAFERLVERFRGPLAAYAFSVLRDRGLAEDAAQEAFLLAYRELAALRDPLRFRPWLYSILENAALSGYRRLRRRRTLRLADEDAVAEGRPHPAAAREEDDPLHLRPEVRAVRAALDRLPRHYGEALLLHYVDGLSAQDLARRLRLTRNNAKMRLRRARRALRRDLEVQGVTGPAAPTAAACPREAAS